MSARNDFDVAEKRLVLAWRLLDSALDEWTKCDNERTAKHVVNCRKRFENTSNAFDVARRALLESIIVW